LAIKKKVTKEKLPAAPASVKVSAFISVLLSEPVDAGFERLTNRLCFLNGAFHLFPP
jgi:hypothetical protein